MANVEQPDTAPVLFERVGEHVAVVRLNRPQAHNAISAAMAEAIEDCVARVDADASLRVAIIAATGRSFCAGADLREVAAGRGAQLVRPQSGFAGFVYATKRKPWIAAVQGAALGGGTEIALSCDMIVAGEEASFGLPEVKRGIIAGASGTYRIAGSVPRAIALEMVTTGAPLSARRAYEVGLVNRVVPTAAVLDAALELAGVIAENSPSSVRESLALARAVRGADEATFRELEAQAIARVLAGPDLQEGAQAFLEKRKPQWRS